jgi:hypothetical protein
VNYKGVVALLVNFNAETIRPGLRSLVLNPKSFPSFPLPVQSPTGYFKDAR